MAMIKGKNQHVVPDDYGWCVIDEASQMFTQHFDTQEEALEHATRHARACEGEVLIHATPCSPSELSTVSLPQREMLPGQAHGTSMPNVTLSKPSGFTNQSPYAGSAQEAPRNKDEFDPL